MDAAGLSTLTGFAAFLREYGPWALTVISWGVSAWLMKRLLASQDGRLADRETFGNKVLEFGQKTTEALMSSAAAGSVRASALKDLSASNLDMAGAVKASTQASEFSSRLIISKIEGASELIGSKLDSLAEDPARPRPRGRA